jgi:hypothetical protein
MAAIRPADPGKAMLKITAFKELFDRRVDGRTPEASWRISASNEITEHQISAEIAIPR